MGWTVGTKHLHEESCETSGLSLACRGTSAKPVHTYTGEGNILAKPVHKYTEKRTEKTSCETRACVVKPTICFEVSPSEEPATTEAGRDVPSWEGGRCPCCTCGVGGCCVGDRG